MTEAGPKQARPCRWCPRPAKDDSEYCAECHEKQKGYQRKAMALLRSARRKRRLCLWCPRRAIHGKRLCSICEIRHETRRVKSAVKRRRDLIADRTDMVTEGDGRTRRRFRGRRKGRQSSAVMDDESIRAVRDEIRDLEDGLVAARSAEIEALPRIQRREHLLAALSHADVARRFLEEMLERYNYPMERE